jgi:molybdenum cofactor biosynthesis enzyme MoaA
VRGEEFIDAAYLSARVLARLRRALAAYPRRAHPTGFTCPRPYYFMSIHPGGTAFCCCPGWVQFPLGTLEMPCDLQRVWNGRAARAFRAAMRTTELGRMCRAESCPWILGGGLPRRDAIGGTVALDVAQDLCPASIAADGKAIGALNDGVEELDYLPRSLDICTDPRCNLFCESCRHARITTLTPAQERGNAIALGVLRALGRELRQLNLSNGEPLYSPFYLELLRGLNRREFPLLEVDIVTNGQLLDKAKWSSLGEGASFVNSIAISVDAATEETYETVRRGGRWARMMENLAFAAELRQSGQISRLLLTYVVTARNFREMPAFVQLGKSLGADRVVFADIQPVDGMSLSHRSSAVHLPEHPLNASYREVLRAKDLHDPVVQLGTRSTAT